MTDFQTTHSKVHYIHKSVSGNVRRLQEGLNRHLDIVEKESLVTALNDYQTRRNVVDFVYNLRGILNTSEKRRTIVPLLRTILPPSDLDVFDHCLQGQHRYGTTPRGVHSTRNGKKLSNNENQFVYGVSTLPTSSKRSAKSAVELKHRSNVVKGLSRSVNSGLNTLGQSKMMKGSNDIIHLSIPQPPPNQGFGFSIRGGCEYGIGIYVSFVGDGGSARESGLEPGDLILEVNNISFRKITHEDAAKIIRCARMLELVVCRVGRIPGSYSVHQSYIWMNPDGRPVSPPPELEVIGQAKSGDPRRSGLMLLTDTDERKMNILVEEGESLGLMIRGGREFGLGIYITGVDRQSVAHRAGLKVGDQILDINRQSFLDISHAEAVEILKQSSHMMMTIKDVGKLPYAKTTVDRTLWLNSDQVRRSHSNRELSNSHKGSNGDLRKSTAFSRGAGSQLMLNTMTSQSWDMVREQARHLLNTTEQDSLRVHINDYQRGFIRVDELVLSLSYLLDTQAKFCLMTEVRNLVFPKDLDKFDALVLKHEVGMLKLRQNHYVNIPVNGSEVEYSGTTRSNFSTRDFSKHGHPSSPDSSPEFSSRSNARHDGKQSNQRMYTSTENITFMAPTKPPRRKLSKTGEDRQYVSSPVVERSNSDVMDRGQRSNHRSPQRNEFLERTRSVEQLSTAVDVHDGFYSMSKPVEELKQPAEGDSGVYMNGSASDSSSPSSGHVDLVQKMKISHSQEEKGSLSSSPTNSTGQPDIKMAEGDENGEAWEMWRQRYGDIPMKPISVYKTQPTLGLAIEGGANTRQPLPKVISVQPGGSAYESGEIKVGHVILEVNGRCLVGMEHNAAARAIAGAFKNKSLDRMDLLVIGPSTDVTAILQRHKASTV